jgi:hypothetical protein
MDGTLDDSTLNIKTYSRDFDDLSQNLCVFADIPFEVITDDMSSTGLDTVLYGQENFDTLSVYWREASNADSITLGKIESLKTNQRMFNSKEKLKLNVKNICELLETAKQYVSDVESSKIPANAEIDRALNNALSKIAHVSPDSIENLVKDHQQDLLFIGKLTSLIQDQLLISQKFTSEIK